MSERRICADCGAPAIASVTEAGVRRDQCAVCAERRVGVPSLLGIAEALRRPRRRDAACPYCGTSAAEAVETGMVGCPLCYEVHREALTRQQSLISAAPDAEGW